MAPSVACLRYNSRATLISISVSFPFSTAAAISLAAACIHSATRANEEVTGVQVNNAHPGSRNTPGPTPHDIEEAVLEQGMQVEQLIASLAKKQVPTEEDAVVLYG